MHPEGAEAGCARGRPRAAAGAARDPGAAVLPSKQLTSVERLEIYAHMYYARLVEVMEAEYPTLRQLLGPHAFAAACRRFVAKNPSRTRTLGGLSARFPDFLAKTLPRSNRNGLAVDVARIERAMEDVFDAPRAEPMTAAEFAALGAGTGTRDAARDAGAPAAEAPLSGERLHECAAPRRPAARPAPARHVRDRLSPRLPGDAARPGAGTVQVAAGARSPAARSRPRCARASAEAASADRVAKRLGKWFEEWAGAHLFVKRGRSPLIQGERPLVRKVKLTF